MPEELKVSGLIAASPNRIYSAWLDERQHTAFTGVRATVDPWVGGRHSSQDGVNEGQLVELDTGKRIVMTWRSTDFPPGSPDSRVEVTLEAVAGGTRVTIQHTEIPEGQSPTLKQNWKTYYLDPMKKYFGKPGAMVAAMRAASAAGKLPIPGVTRATPGAVPQPVTEAPSGEIRIPDDDDDDEDEVITEEPEEEDAIEVRRQTPPKPARPSKPPRGKPAKKKPAPARKKAPPKKAKAKAKAKPRAPARKPAKRKPPPKKHR